MPDVGAEADRVDRHADALSHARVQLDVLLRVGLGPAVCELGPSRHPHAALSLVALRHQRDRLAGPVTGARPDERLARRVQAVVACGPWSHVPSVTFRAVPQPRAW